MVDFSFGVNCNSGDDDEIDDYDFLDDICDERDFEIIES